LGLDTSLKKTVPAQGTLPAMRQKIRKLKNNDEQKFCFLPTHTALMGLMGLIKLNPACNTSHSHTSQHKPQAVRKIATSITLTENLNCVKN